MNTSYLIWAVLFQMWANNAKEQINNDELSDTWRTVASVMYFVHSAAVLSYVLLAVFKG